GDARMRRVLAARHADEETGIVGERRPHDVLLAGRRARLNAIDLPADASVARRIVRTARLVPRLRDLAVAVRVDHERTPALRRLLVARLVEEPRVDPAEIALADQRIEPERLVLVVRELQVMRREARIDQRELARLGIEVRNVPARV